MKSLSKLIACSYIILSVVRMTCADGSDIARLQLELEDPGNPYFEGFASAVHGDVRVRRSHRGDRARARLVSASDGAQSTSWLTREIPPGWDGERATFLWVCGIGCSHGAGTFDLAVNGTHELAVTSRDAGSWQVDGDNGCDLRFAGVDCDEKGDRFGYMVLRVPGKMLTRAAPVKLTLTRRRAESQAWMALFEYPDALSYFQAVDKRVVYCDWSWHNFGTVSLSLSGAPEMVGRTFVLEADGRVLGGGQFNALDTIAAAAAYLPAPLTQSALDIAVFVDGVYADRFSLPDFARRRARGFVGEEIAFDAHVFPPGAFPQCSWRRPGVVENQVGAFDLEVTFHDSLLRPVTQAEREGRYGAVVAGTAPNGYAVRRYVTLFCSERSAGQLLREALTETGAATPPAGTRLETAGAALHGHFLASAARGIAHDPETARILAGLHSPGPEAYEPILRDAQWWVDYKRQEAGDADRFPPLLRPTSVLAHHARRLRKNTAGDCIYTEAQCNAIRNVCVDWADRAEIPFVLLLAHRGEIVLHEAFGATSTDDDAQRETATPVGSLNALLAGSAFMMFADQGLMSLDDPLGKFLPEFPVPEENAVTFRHLFTHTAGLAAIDDARRSLSDVSLENRAAYYADHLDVGETTAYSELGYALAGKAMERVSGKAFALLVREHLVKPLQLEHTTFSESGACESTCLDMARLAQMLLNGGAYGNMRFFSHETCDQMMPAGTQRALMRSRAVGRDNSARGIGAAPAPEKQLGRRAFGHNAESGFIFRAAPSLGLIIVVARGQRGKDYDNFAQRVIRACAEPVAD